MGDLIHRNNASKDKIIASNVLMGQGNNKTDTVEKRIRDLEESGGGGGSDVEVTPLLHEGVHIADINVNGERSELYAPEGGGTGTITDVEVNGVSVVTEGVANIDISGKQNVLTAGTNVSISGDVISATDTTYNDVVGATSEADGVHGLMPAPTSSDLDKAVRGDGTWGYAGAIDDIQVNGQSVVENKIAEITSYKEVTQAEYDALSEAQKMNGVAYFIKDAMLPSRSAIYAPVIYSTKERMIGTWTDGRPLYQVTKIFTNISSGRVNLAHGIANVRTLMLVNWKFATSSEAYGIVGFDTLDTSNNYLCSIITYDSTNISYRLGAGWNATRLFCTFQYTKTTDVAGSGNWGADGIPMQHYSTSEKVIGTWLDGKTLYEKTVVFGTQLTISSNTWTDTELLKSGIDNIVEITTMNTDGTTWSSVGCRARASTSSYVQLFNTRNADISIKYITIRYTKTT